LTKKNFNKFIFEVQSFELTTDESSDEEEQQNTIVHIEEKTNVGIELQHASNINIANSNDDLRPSNSSVVITRIENNISGSFGNGSTKPINDSQNGISSIKSSNLVILNKIADKKLNKYKNKFGGKL
jgi:hypothetical protein